MKTKRFISTLLALLLVCSLPVSAFAEDDNPPGTTVTEIATGDTMGTNSGTVTTNNGEVTTNYGEVTTNNGTKDNHDKAIVETNNDFVYWNHGTVTTNNNLLDNNFGTVTNNHDQILKNYNGAEVTNNNKGALVLTNRGTVKTNNGTVGINQEGTVETNNGTVQTSDDGGIVKTNNGTVGDNGIFGTVETNSSTGTVDTNGGTVTTNNGTVTTNRGNGTVTTNNGTVDTNGGTVTTNNGTVEDNCGTVEANNNYISANEGTVTTNNGTVDYNPGIVETNNGTVNDNAGGVIINNTTGIVNEGYAGTNYGTVKLGDTTWYGVLVDNDGEKTLEEYCTPGQVLDFSKLTKEGYVYAGYTQEYQLLNGVLTKQALTVSDTSYTVTCPNVLTLIWQAIFSPTADDGTGSFGPGSFVSINGNKFLLVAVMEDVYFLASVDSFGEEQLSDLPALLATLLTEEQLTHVTGEPELLDEELTARFFGGEGSHIVFPCDSSLIFS